MQTRIHSWGLFLVHKLTCGKRESELTTLDTKIDEQWDCGTLCAIKFEGKNRGEGTTPVTTACPEAGK